MEDKIIARRETVEKISSQDNKQVWARFSRHVKQAFFQHLAEDYRPQLVAAGLSEAQIEKMSQGKSPNTERDAGDPWMVHHVTPRTVSGRLSDANQFDNLALIRKSSEQELHHVIDPQFAELTPGQAKEISMVRPTGHFCALTRTEARSQVQAGLRTLGTQDRETAPERPRFGNVEFARSSKSHGHHHASQSRDRFSRDY
jgi:hypothetical protein